MDDALDVQCIMLSAMTPELQRQHEVMDAQSILLHLEELYFEKARQERYDISNALFLCKIAEGSPVGPHVLKMIGYIERLGNLGFVMDNDLYVDLVLSSLPPSFSNFIVNFNMNNMEKMLPELLAMVRQAEKDMRKGKSSQVLMVNQKGKGKGKAKAQSPKARPKPKVKGNGPSKKARIEPEGNEQ